MIAPLLYQVADSSQHTVVLKTGFQINPYVVPSGVVKYFPVSLYNNQSSATPVPFDQKVVVDSASYRNYESANLQNVLWFTSSGLIIPSWLENNGLNTSSSTTYWLKFQFSIPANSDVEIYLGFVNKTIDLFSAQGAEGTSSGINMNTDNGASVFSAYYPGSSLTGWSKAGISGGLSPAPAGSLSGSWAFYALNARGSYLYRVASAQSNNMIIEYYTYDNRLDDLFFLSNITGNGQYSRVGDINGSNNAWYGIGSTYSWTSWRTPPSYGGHWQNQWLTIGVVVKNGEATEYLVPGSVTYGSELGKNPSNTATVSDMGNYLGLVGDAKGSANEYWNGIIIRPLPPSNVMPSVSFAPVSNSHPTGIGSTFNFLAFLESYAIPILAGIIAAILIIYASRRDEKSKK